MNYREQQFRQIIKKGYVPRKSWQAVELQNALLNSDLEALRTSLDYSNLDNWERENQQLKAELTNLQAFSEEQHNLINSQENTIQGLNVDLTQKKQSPH